MVVPLLLQSHCYFKLPRERGLLHLLPGLLPSVLLHPALCSRQHPVPRRRAVTAPSPFAVARDNLATHLQQNRAACQRLDSAAAAGGEQQQQLRRGLRPASQALRELRLRQAIAGGCLQCTLPSLYPTVSLLAGS